MIAGKIDFAQLVGDGQKVVFEAEHLDEPAKLANAIEAAAEVRDARRQFEPAAEIEPRAAHADTVEPVQLRVADTVVDDGDAAIIPLRRGFENVVQQPMIGAVDGGLHEHRAVDAHGVVQSLHHCEGAISAAAHRARCGLAAGYALRRQRHASAYRRCFSAVVRTWFGYCRHDVGFAG